MDWLLIPIWAGMPKASYGLGYSSTQVGEISFYCFPGILIACFIGYLPIKLKQVDWMIYTSYTFFFLIVLTPTIVLFKLSDTYSMVWLVIFESIKVMSFLIYSTSWSVLMNGLVQSTILGRIYSFSFCFSHLGLIVVLQVIPRLLTWSIENNGWNKMFGRFSVVMVFFLLGLPCVWGVRFGNRVRRVMRSGEVKGQAGVAAVQVSEVDPHV